jgi:ribosome-binding protein aMBF1 (putative translation factor)
VVALALLVTDLGGLRVTVAIHHERLGRVAINGEALRAGRERKGWKLSVVAGQLDISEKTLSRYEAGERDPKWLDVARLAVLLELGPVELFFGTTGRPKG